MPEDSNRSRWARLALVIAAVLLTVTLGADLAAGEARGSTVSRQVETDQPQIPVNPEVDPERARRTADEILSGDEYQAPDPQGRTIGDRIREWLDRQIDMPTFGRQGDSGAFDLGAWIVLGAVVIGGVAAAVWVIASSRRRRTAPDDEDTDSEIDITPLRSPDEWQREAERCEREGDHRGAVRARFRSLTTFLAERHLVANTPGRTAGEMRGDVAERAPALTPTFGAMSDLFERAWYGPGTVGSGQSTSARELADTVRKAAPRRPAAGSDVDADAGGPSTSVTTTTSVDRDATASGDADPETSS